MDNYTLITGGSMGFGKALALECASKKMNLILVSLPGEDLHDLALCIRRTYNVSTIALEVDLCEEGACLGLYNQVNAMGLKVNMLINNAGLGCSQLFENGSATHYDQQVRLNVLATTMLTHLFLKDLKQNSPSHILNVGSVASFFSLPKKQVYGATKSFIYYFSQSLRRELKTAKISVSVVCPGGMFTNSTIRKSIANASYLSRMSSMNPEAVAAIAIGGMLRKKAVIIPGRINKTIVFLNKFLPRFIVGFFEDRTMKKLNMISDTKPCLRKNTISIFPLQAVRATESSNI